MDTCGQEITHVIGFSSDFPQPRGRMPAPHVTWQVQLLRLFLHHLSRPQWEVGPCCVSRFLKMAWEETNLGKSHHFRGPTMVAPRHSQQQQPEIMPRTHPTYFHPSEGSSSSSIRSLCRSAPGDRLNCSSQNPRTWKKKNCLGRVVPETRIKHLKPWSNCCRCPP